MQAAVSGLSVYSQRFSAISDNISNAGTIGYKKSDVQFSTMVLDAAGSETYAAGGVRSVARKQVSLQGGLKSTASATDFAINGRGFFAVADSTTPFDGKGQGQISFTRAGSFVPDENGYLKNAAGAYLMGWELMPDGTYKLGEPARNGYDSLRAVNTESVNYVGSPTENIVFSGNLPAQLTKARLSTDAAPSNQQTVIEYFDPLGNPQTITMQWVPTSPTYTPPATTPAPANQWTLNIYDTGSTTPATPIAQYEIDFNPSGTIAGTMSSIKAVGGSYLYDPTQGVIPLALGRTFMSSDIPALHVDGKKALNTDPRSVSLAERPVNAGDIFSIDFGGGVVATYTAVAGDTVDTVGTALQGVVTGLGYPCTAWDTYSNSFQISSGAGLADIDLTSPIPTQANTARSVTLDPRPVQPGDIYTVTFTPPPQAGLPMGSTTVSYTATSTDTLDTIAAALAAKVGKGATVTLSQAGPVANAVTATPVGALATDPRTISLANREIIPGDVYTVQVGGNTLTYTAVVGDTLDTVGGQLQAQAAAVAGYTVGSWNTATKSFGISSGAGLDAVTSTVTTSIAAGPHIDIPASAGLGANTIRGGQPVDLHIGMLNDFNGVTQFNGSYVPSRVTKDGEQFSDLDRVEVNQYGILEAIFQNGQRRAIYQIPLADVTNPDGMNSLDGNRYTLSQESGELYFWDAGTGPAGKIAGSTLEQSNVDIAEELTLLIETQRSYGSNAKVIQSADEMLDTVNNLKR